MNKLMKQGAWYLFAGASAALIELALFSLLHELIGLEIVWANVIATVIATAYNFIVNRTKTFESTSNPIRSVVLYVILFLVNMTVSTLAISALAGLGVPAPAAKAFMQVCVVAWNFVLYRKVIFV